MKLESADGIDQIKKEFVVGTSGCNAEILIIGLWITETGDTIKLCHNLGHNLNCRPAIFPRKILLCWVLFLRAGDSEVRVPRALGSMGAFMFDYGDFRLGFAFSRLGPLGTGRRRIR